MNKSIFKTNKNGDMSLKKETSVADWTKRSTLELSLQPTFSKDNILNRGREAF